MECLQATHITVSIPFHSESPNIQCTTRQVLWEYFSDIPQRNFISKCKQIQNCHCLSLFTCWPLYRQSIS